MKSINLDDFISELVKNNDNDKRIFSRKAAVKIIGVYHILKSYCSEVKCSSFPIPKTVFSSTGNVCIVIGKDSVEDMNDLVAIIKKQKNVKYRVSICIDALKLR